MDSKQEADSSPEKRIEPLDSGVINTAQTPGNGNKIYQNINHSTISDNSISYKIENTQILGQDLNTLALNKQIQDKKELIELLEKSGQITRVQEVSLELDELKKKKNQIIEFIQKFQNTAIQGLSEKSHKEAFLPELNQTNENSKSLSQKLYEFQLKLEENLTKIPSYHNYKDFLFDVIKINKHGSEVCRFQGRTKQIQYLLAESLVVDMMIIPCGLLLMGPSKIEAKISGGEVVEPQKRISVDAFCISRFPITKKQWSIVAKFPKIDRDLKARPSLKGKHNTPVTHISWLDAIEFCKRLSCYFEKDFRLPTEYEWEYACRAGTDTPFHFGPTITTELANYDGNYVYCSGPKGRMIGKPNALGDYNFSNSFGLVDMHGNVWEWCLEKYGDMHLKHMNIDTLPLKKYRILRGGSWMNEPLLCRSSSRLTWREDKASNLIGFRVACLIDT
ncbi:hypothetical protein Lepto7375DRAFT_2483 [Leptolyngbya sp. PCC 7375]|nr:hypothetical protein Lepto7375DRAFT_2483 [Leptolyngbya sp. PCC 7375]